MKCILHAGAHKTGTTAIQNAMHGYDDGRLLYADLIDTNHGFALEVLFSDSFRERQSYERLGFSFEDIREQYRSALHKTLQTKRETIVFSGENISTFDIGLLERMRDSFREAFDAIEVILFVREPLDWTCSYMQTCVRLGERLDDIMVRSFRSRIENLRMVFGAANVHLHRYEDHLSSEDGILSAFCDLIGAEKVNIDDRERELNKAILSDTFNVLCRFNELGLLYENGRFGRTSRSRFIRRLALIFRDGAKLTPADFSAYCHFDDYEFLSEAAGLHYEKTAAEAPSGNSGFEIGADQTAALYEFLGDLGLEFGSARDTDSAIKALYYYCLAEEFSAAGLVGADGGPVVPGRLSAGRAEHEQVSAASAADYALHRFLGDLKLLPPKARERFLRAAERRLDRLR
ncbi:MAG: hypothetical protein AAGE80_17895 [Pseudomonadota bacterium]